jgi:hypothetical protein
MDRLSRPYCRRNFISFATDEDDMSRLQLRLKQRHRFRIAVGCFVSIMVAISLGWFWHEADSIRTHTLPVGNIQVSLPYSKYLINEPISFTVKNNYNSPVYFANDCPQEPLSVYRLTGSSWIRIHDTARFGACPQEDRRIVVPAYGQVQGNFAAWPKLFNQPGHYRIVAYVEYYATLPYQDFDVVTPPAPILAIASQLQAAAQTPSGGTVAPTKALALGTTQSAIASLNSTKNPIQTPAPTSQPPANKYVSQHYTLTVNAGGNYTPTSLSLHPTDVLTIVYAKPYNNEVRTHFYNVGATTSSLSSVTVDSEFTSRMITLTTTGEWTYKADDHSGNSGDLRVN